MPKIAFRQKLGTTVLLLVLGCPFHSRAQEVRVPVEVQFELFSKILVFDRNLQSRVGGEIVFGIIYQRLYRASVDVAEAFRELLNQAPGHKLSGFPFRIVMIDLEKANPLDKAILDNEVNVLYVAPLRAFDVKAVSSVSRTHGILTLTGVPGYSYSDLSVSVDSVGGKPQVLVNLTAAVAEGCNFSSRLLNLVTIVGPKDGERR